MSLRWVLVDLNGTLLDPACIAIPLGGGSSERALVQRAFSGALLLTMAGTLAGLPYRPLDEHLAAALERELRASGQGTDRLEAALGQAKAMHPFTDAQAALDRLATSRLRLGVLTNSTARGAEMSLDSAGLRSRFELVLGTDEVEVFKPHPHVYRRAVERLGVDAEEICLVAAHTWDILGAASQHLKTAWVAREETWLVPTAPEPDFQGRDLLAVADAIASAGS